MKKLLFIFGTRPEAIKMAPLVIELKKAFNVKVCVTAQHREMLDQVLNLFDITPDYDLNIMRPGQDLTELTANILVKLKDVLIDSAPDFTLVHGDTTTSMAGALASFYQQIPVIHVEAGLRTHDIYSPFPEEINRQITGRISTLHLAPTVKAEQNLLAEGVAASSIYVTGNTVIDALLMTQEKANAEPFNKEVLSIIPEFHETTAKKPEYVLVTGHRRENFGDGFKNICLALKELALRYPEKLIIYPVHLNPNVLNVVHDMVGDIPNIRLIAPQDYLPFVKLMSNATVILTDSGGVQEEAPSLGVPVLVMRNTTERPEAIEAGTVKLVGTNAESIVKHVSALLDSKTEYNTMARAINPYGDGKACQRIKDYLLTH